MRTSYLHAKITDPILRDFFKFFSTKSGADVLPYAYMGSSDYYNSLIKNCPDYYLSHDEIELIHKNAKKFKKHLKNVTDIIEIGPGSEFALMNKTLPMIKYADNLTHYHALDCATSYLEQTSNFIKKQLPNIESHSIIHNLLSDSSITISPTVGKKCFLFLGGSINNFTTKQQLNILKKIEDCLDPGDLFMFTSDTNQDPISILKAYSNDYQNNFIREILIFFSMLNPSFEPYISCFDIDYQFNKKEHKVQASFIAKQNITFPLNKEINITLHKSQKLKCASSKKLSVIKLTSFLQKNTKFKIIDIINNSNKMQNFICQKI